MTEQRLYFADQLDPVSIVQDLNSGPCTEFQLRVGKTGKNKDSRRLTCHRGRTSRKARGSNTKTTTDLPTSEDEKCSFSFTINRDRELDRWFIRKSNNHCWEHCGHIRVHRDLQYDTIRQVPLETLETAQALLHRLIPPSIIGQYIEHECNKTLSSNSLKWLRYTVLREKHAGKGDANESTAQKLINMLENTKGMAYVTYTGKALFASIACNLLRNVRTK